VTQFEMESLLDMTTVNDGPKPLSPIGEVALRYAVERRWAVFPVWWITTERKCACGKTAGRNHKPGKHPIGLAGTGGFHMATKDLAQIRAWWARWPLGSIGVEMGDKSGVFAIDLDGAQGHRVLGEARRANNAPPIKTLTSQSGRGPDGHHLIFHLPVGGRVGRVIRKDLGVDIIGNGGFIVVPPSNHISGGTYRWSHDYPVATPDPWLMDWVRSLFDKPASPGSPPRNCNDFTSLVDRALHALSRSPAYNEYDDARLRSALDYVDSAGKRIWDPNDPSYALWGQVVAPAIASLEWGVKGEDIFVDWSKQTAVDGLFPGEEACRQQIRSYGRKQGCLTEATIFKAAREAGWLGIRGLVTPGMVAAQPTAKGPRR
jgi:Bifunctional DNA primase/polymerase, N-terminal